MAKPPAIKITNREFLEALAGKDWARVPIQWGDSFWAHPAGKKIDKLSPEDSCYYTLTIFNVPPGHPFRRIKEWFYRQFAFVIDDVGTKVNEAAVRAVMPPATYELETSPGNWQFGYKLLDGVDPRALEALVDAIVDDPEINPSLKDPGMKGVTRVVRLPVGSNNKPKWKDASGKGWPHRLALWEPQRAYTVGQLAFHLGVDLREENLERFKGAGGTRKATAEEIGEDPIMKLFDMRGMILDPNVNDNGFINVVCPWADQHSDERNEAGYRPGRRGFQCHHGHCEDKGMPELMAWAVETATAEERAGAFGEVFPAIADDDPRLAAAEKAVVVAETAKVEKAKAVYKAVEGEWSFVRDLHRFGCVSRRELLPERTFNAEPLGLSKYGKSGEKSQAALFLNDPNSVRCKTATYEPGRPPVYVDPDDGENVFNLWRAGAVQPWPLEFSPSDLQVWLDHVDFILPDPIAKTMFLRWCAFILQNPGEKINWAFLLIGEQGTGKNMMLQPLLDILGKENYSPVKAEEIGEQWTDWAEKQVIVIEELPSFHKRDVYDWLKSFVAEGTTYFRVNKKNIAQYNVRNLQNWFIFSNHEDALALEADDRRYFVYASPVRKKEAGYYRMLKKALKDAAFLSKLYAWLLDFDLAGFNPGEAPPMTEAKRRMMEATSHPVDRWLDEQFDGGKYEGRKLVQTSEILSDAQSGGRHNGVAHDVARTLNQTRIGRWFGKNGWRQMERRRLPTLGRVRLWVAPGEPFELLEQLQPGALETRYAKDAGLPTAGSGGGEKGESDSPF